MSVKRRVCSSKSRRLSQSKSLPIPIMKVGDFDTKPKPFIHDQATLFDPPDLLFDLTVKKKTSLVGSTVCHSTEWNRKKAIVMPLFFFTQFS
jgi:hypothetical protein